MAQENNNNSEQLVQNKYRLGVFYTKIYRVIPKNCVLLVRSKFSGQNVEIRKGGFAFVAPWKEAKLVSLAEKVIDYPKIEFDDKNGQSVFIDYAITVRISNPIKYEYAHQNIDEALKILLTSAVRVLVRKATWEEMAGKHFEITQNGANSSVNNTEFDDELDEIVQLFAEFDYRYGLKIVDFKSKDVQQSQEMQKAYDEKVRKIKEGEAKEAEVRKLQEVARIEAETRIINAKADSEVAQIMNEVNAKKRKLELESILSGLNGLPELQLMEIIKAYVLANGENPHTNIFASVGNKDLIKTAIVNNMPVESGTDGKEPLVKKK